MTLRHLNIFLTVCKEKSITKAGEKLFISQPAVSNAIKELDGAEYQGRQMVLKEATPKRSY